MTHTAASKASDAARKRREHDVRTAVQFLADGRQQWVHQILIVDGPDDADVSSFLRDVGFRREPHAMFLRAPDVPGADPVHHALTAAIWHRMPDDAEQLHDALVRTMPRGTAPSVETLVPLLRRGNAPASPYVEAPPPAFASYLPDRPHELLEVLRSIDTTKSWWLFIDGTDLEVASLDFARAFVAARARDLRISAILGTNLTHRAAKIVDAFRRSAPGRTHVLSILPVPRDARGAARPPVVDFMFPRKEARAAGERAQWNDRIITAVIALIQALGRVHDEQVADLAEILGVPELHRLLEDYEGIRHDVDHFAVHRQPAAVSGKDIEAEIMALTERLVTDREWHRTTAQKALRNLPRRAAGGWHPETERLYGALLTTAYRYVRRRDPATAVALFDRAKRTEDSSDTRFMLLYELFRDSQHLSVIDYALDRMAGRDVESSFHEMRMFRQACEEAQRYNDRWLFEQLTVLAHRERLKQRIVPQEIEAIAYGVVWTGADTAEWVSAFEERLREFRMTVADLRLRRVVFHDETAPPPAAAGPSPRRKRKRERQSG